MENELQTRVCREMNSIILQHWAWETRHEEDCSRATRKNFGELRQDLGKVVAIPQRLLAIHRRADETSKIGPLAAQGLQLGQELDEDGLNPERDGGGALAASQEVGDAGKQAHVGFLPDLLERLGQDFKTAARDGLGADHQWPVAAVQRVQMSFDVRIANHCKNQSNSISF